MLGCTLMLSLNSAVDVAWAAGGLLGILCLLILGQTALQVAILALSPERLRELAHPKNYHDQLQQAFPEVTEAVENMRERLRELIADPPAFQRIFPETSEKLEKLKQLAQDRQAFQRAFPETSQAVVRLRELSRDPKALQKAFPETAEAVAGGGWWLLSYPSPMNLVWMAKILRGWCKNAVWSFRENRGVKGFVALTIDDAPGRGDTHMAEVLDLLDEYDAKATFFVIAGHFEGKEHLVRECVQRGHELGNHCVEDIPYHKHTEQQFSDALLQCEERIRESGFKLPLTHEVSNFRKKWFRPPQGRCSSQMRKVLHEQGYTIAMCDVFGMDTHCGEPYVSSYVLKHVKDGSVLLMHMPEVGFREHNLEAIQKVLHGLRERGSRCTTLSHMHEIAYV